jgi:hypothetical protein
MVHFDETLISALVVYCIAAYALYTLKHEKMFDENGHFRCFGLHPGETVFPFWLVTTVIGLATYYALTLKQIYS